MPILVQGEEELRERSRQIASVGFDVTQQVPMRATVLRRDDQVHSHVLVIVIHHIAADGFSTVTAGSRSHERILLPCER